MLVSLFRNIAIFPFLMSFLLTFISVPAVIQFAKYFGLVDDAKKHNHPAITHTGIIPRAGGLAIFLGIVVSLMFFLPLSKTLVGIVLGMFVILVEGLIDDKYDLSPKLRLALDIFAILLVIAGGVGISYLTNPLGGVINLDTWRWSFDFMGRHSILVFADLFALIWILWVTHAVAFSGGVDGQLPGFVVISAVVIGIISFNQLTTDNFPYWIATTLAFITAGSYLGFLPWNFYPQKIMPGYSGKRIAGLLLGTLAIISAAKVGAAILVLGVPLIDAGYVVLDRILHRKSPMSGSSSHLHHRLLQAGWDKRRIALFYWSLSAILGIVALYANVRQKFYAVIVVAVFVLTLISWLKIYTTFLKRSAPDNGLKI